MKILLFLVAALMVCPSLVRASETVPATMPSRNEQSIIDVKEGRLTEANAAWWGFDEADSTAAIQNAIESAATKVVIPNVGKPWIITPVHIRRSNLELVFEPGVEVVAKKGEFLDDSASMFTVAEQENITITGYGATIRMHKTDYTKPPWQKGEWRMGLSLLSCTNVKVYGLTIKETGGDGIYLGSMGQKLAFCQDVHIKDVVCDGNYRQGISVVSAKNVLIEDSVFKNTSGTAPSAGIDLEVHDEKEVLVNVTVRNCLSENNAGPGFLIYYVHNTKKSPDVSVLIDKCRVDGARIGLGVGGAKDDGPDGTIEFRDCVVENTKDYGAYVYDKAADRGLVKFTRCTWRNVKQSGVSAAARSDGSAELDPAADAPVPITVERPNSAMLIFSKRAQMTTKLGGIVFDQCVLEDQVDRPWLAVSGTHDAYTVKNVRGTIRVVSPYRARVQSPVPISVRATSETP